MRNCQRRERIGPSARALCCGNRDSDVRKRHPAAYKSSAQNVLPIRSRSQNVGLRAYRVTLRIVRSDIRDGVLNRARGAPRVCHR